MERGVAVATAIDINAVVGQIDKYHAAFRCYNVLNILLNSRAAPLTIRR